MAKYDHVYADLAYSGLADGPGDYGPKYARYLVELEATSERLRRCSGYGAASQSSSA